MRKILGVILFSLLLRIILSPFGTWAGDMGSWTGWSNRLLEVGFGRFYEAWSDYLPGYMYVLFIWGNLWKALNIYSFVPQDVFYKIPSILSDGATIYLIYLIVKKLKDERSALLAAFLYGVSPAIWGNSALWGQADSFAALPIVLSLYFIINSKYLLAGLFLGVAAVLKPSGMFLGPLFLVYIFINTKNLKNLFLFLLPAISVFLLAFVPFSDLPPGGEVVDFFLFIISRFQATLDQYKYTSLNAFNFWAIDGGWWKDDSARFFLFTLQQWGVVIFGAIYGLVLLNLKFQNSKIKTKTQNLKVIIDYDLILGSVIIFLAGFLFLTRAHERHIFPVFAFLAIAAGVNPRLWTSFILLSIISSLNLRYAYVWLTKSFEQIFSSIVVSFFSLLSIGILGYLMRVLSSQKVFAVLAPIPRQARDGVRLRAEKLFATDKTPYVVDKVKNWKKYFVIILILGIFTRFFYLNTPPSHMFDEVYHAFTAQEMVKGNVAAWEWWNTPPQGFAYEWSHPPFAKLAMVVPLKIFGVEKAWAWRSAVALFGVGVIVLMYLFTRELFGVKIGLIAMFLATFEGLILTMSRIGMNDIFFVFWMLAGFLVFIKKKYLWAGIFLGLSLSSKWTALYGIGILGFWYLVILMMESKDKMMAAIEAVLKGFAFFVAVPLIIYLIVYIPFFTSGHDFSKFVELQKQMWWYHTGLRATHPYQSQFWQWPLDLRPVWFWVDYKDKTTANIYNLGNPAIFWGGDIAVVVLLFLIFKFFILNLSRKLRDPAVAGKSILNNKIMNSKTLNILNSKDVFGLLFMLSGLLGFWLPWARSPRIMFFYHFLPSLMFVIIILAWILSIIKDKRIVFGYLIIVTVLFIYFSPILYGFPVPKELVDQFFWIKSWR